MATIQVQSAFVEGALTGERGVWALKTSEPHSRKNDRDEWETVSRTFRTVRVSGQSGIDLSQFRKGDRITFAGTEKTDVREHNGKKYYDLLVWAESINLANGAATSSVGEQTETEGDWGSGSDVPF